MRIKQNPDIQNKSIIPGIITARHAKNLDIKKKMGCTASKADVAQRAYNTDSADDAMQMPQRKKVCITRDSSISFVGSLYGSAN